MRIVACFAFTAGLTLAACSSAQHNVPEQSERQQSATISGNPIRCFGEYKDCRRSVQAGANKKCFERYVDCVVTF